MIVTAAFLGLIASLFFLSRRVTNELFFLFYKLVKNKHLALYIVSFIYFPGTVIHELSHFFAAAALLLNVKNISIFPEITDEYVKLGSVQYERADYIRGLLVGVAPFFVGLLIFYIFATQNILTSPSWLIKLIATYAIFVLSSTMFSSKKDLADLIFVLPVVVIIPIVLYIIHFDFSTISINENVKDGFFTFITRINYYLLISVLINVAILCIVKILHIKKKYV